MSTLELAMSTISAWVQGGCVGKCEVVIAPPVTPAPPPTTDTAPSGTLSVTPVGTVTTKPDTKWVDDTINAIATNFVTLTKKVSIEGNGATHTFTITVTH